MCLEVWLMVFNCFDSSVDIAVEWRAIGRWFKSGSKELVLPCLGMDLLRMPLLVSSLVSIFMDDSSSFIYVVKYACPLFVKH